MSGKLRLLTLALLLLGTPVCLAKGLWENGDLQQAKTEALQCELTGKWKQIHWRGTMQQAMADAATSQKPIMVALVVGKSGEKNATDC
ncbi:MAG TPA: hypothetical protein V6C81_28800 [Planktothrix sp.]